MMVTRMKPDEELALKDVYKTLYEQCGHHTVYLMDEPIMLINKRSGRPFSKFIRVMDSILYIFSNKTDHLAKKLGVSVTSRCLTFGTSNTTWRIQYPDFFKSYTDIGYIIGLYAVYFESDERNIYMREPNTCQIRYAMYKPED